MERSGPGVGGVARRRHKSRWPDIRACFWPDILLIDACHRLFSAKWLVRFLKHARHAFAFVHVIGSKNVMTWFLSSTLKACYSQVTFTAVKPVAKQAGLWNFLGLFSASPFDALRVSLHQETKRSRTHSAVKRPVDLIAFIKICPIRFGVPARAVFE